MNSNSNNNNNSEPEKGQFYEIVSKSGRANTRHGIFMRTGVVPEGKAPAWIFSNSSGRPIYATPSNTKLKAVPYTRAASKTRRAGRKSRRNTRRHRR